MSLIQPHGRKLINKNLSFLGKIKILGQKDNFKKIVLNPQQIEDVRNIANGVYSPLEGFLKEKNFKSVVEKMRLFDGTVWPIPILLDISEDDYQNLKTENKVLLVDKFEKPLALLENIEIYHYEKNFLAEKVFGTKDINHPGVDEVYKMGDYLIGGEVKLLEDSREPFVKYNFSPAETREIFKKRRWQKIVAFQTRNAPHRGHEFLQKQALKEADGLFIQPVIGKKKIGDFKDEYILASYEVLIDRYYPKDKVLLGILPLKMRYAGPREAVFHALIRKNFGCSHFIVGRDHAGVGNYYPPFAAQNIFDNFKKEEIGIEILKYPEVVYCPFCQKHTFGESCCSNKKIFFSGTKLRDFIKRKEQPPLYLIRPEVYFFLSHSANSLVDEMYKDDSDKNQQGFILWFTGLSQSGKTTIADRIYNFLREKRIKVERLDGDVVREHLSKDLGFSKKDRDENIRRVGYVAKLLSRKGIGVIASFISPYRATREEIRKDSCNFIEVFCNAPVEVCEKRDTKGLYQKARRGEIKNFTGISDPYEPPQNPEIELKTDIETIDMSVSKVIKYLKKHGFI